MSDELNTGMRKALASLTAASTVKSTLLQALIVIGSIITGLLTVWSNQQNIDIKLSALSLAVTAIRNDTNDLPALRLAVANTTQEVREMRKDMYVPIVKSNVRRKD